MLTRRAMLILLLSAVSLQSSPALASDDNDSEGGGNSGSGSNNSGSGSSNSGSGSSTDDNDDDDDDDSGDDDQAQAQEAVEKGEAIELRQVLATVRRRYPGRIVSVRLKGNGSRLQYRIRVIDKNNRLLNLGVNARTGQIIAGSQ
jgi:hypothetical protein